MDNIASAADSIAAHTTKNAMKTPMEDLAMPTSVDVDSLGLLGIDKPQHCVFHPAESETFRRSVVAHCAAESATLGQIAAIWIRLISQSVPPSECVTVIAEHTSLSAAQVRRRIHYIRALSVKMLESQLGITAADV